MVDGKTQRGCFVTGTDTDVGKTVATAALLRALRAEGGDALAVKPVQTGIPVNISADSSKDDGELSPLEDAARYSAAAGPKHALTLETFVPACSPHLAAEMAGRELRVDELAARLAELDGFLVVEGAGGAAVPLNREETTMDLMCRLDLPVVLVTVNKLGCVNHVLLSLEALRSRGLTVAAVVFHASRPVAPHPGMEGACGADEDDDGGDRWLTEDNIVTVRDFGRVPLVLELPFLPALDRNSSLWSEEAEQTAWSTLAACLKPLAEALQSGDSARNRAEAHLRKGDHEREGASPHATRPDNVKVSSSSASFTLPGSPSVDFLGDSAGNSPDVMPPAGLLDFDRRHLWHPYTSATKPLPVYEAVSTRGVRIRLRDGRELVDGMASWWCAIHGYGHPALIRALRDQAGRMAHVMFGGLTHQPAVGLAERLLRVLPAGLEHVFLADSGSVSVEVALKMALQYWQSKGCRNKSRFLTIRGGYHGDTLGAMSVCDPVTGMHSLFTDVVPRQIFVSRPSCRFDAPFEPSSLDEMADALARHADELAAVILEPVVQGAGGMWFYHPDYLRGLRALCDRHGVLLILDEIATGFGRTGRMFAAEWAGVSPDIMCLGKALTGGTMTLAATAATHAVAAGISADGGVFMHGPTFMGNPLACAVACASLDILHDAPWGERVEALEHGMTEGLEPCRRLPGVADVRVLGSIGVVEVEKPLMSADVARLQAFFVERGAWLRPFNQVIYMMPSYVMEPDDLSLLTSVVAEALRAGVHLA